MATFGDTLKRERELRKISLREVSEATKIGLRYLEAMEGNRFEQLPGGVFNKGFIRAYAKFIGLDGEALINTYLYDVAHRKKAAGPAPEGSHHPALTIEDLPLPNPPEKPGRKAKAPAAPGKYVAMGTAALLMVAAGAWLLFARRPATAPAAAEPRDERGATPQTAGLLRSQPRASEPGLPSEPTDSTSPTKEAAPAPDPGSAKDSKETQHRRGERALGILVGTAEPTWISIRCGGVEKLKRDLIEGEMVAFSCRSDLLLSTGNAGALSLWVEGRECLPLGERGAVLQDFLLDSARVAEICPPEEKP
jgi:cytoskeleton protein RodZ